MDQQKSLDMGRIMCMGDIHGSYHQMLQCFERSNFDFENDTLIQLGDICDGNQPYIYECVELLLQVKNLIQIRGNHDDWFITWLNTGIHPTKWLQGGFSTMQSYINYANKPTINPFDIPDTHVRFFRGMHDKYIDDKNRLFIHGGFDRRSYLSQQDRNEYWWNRSLFNKAMSAKGNSKLKTVDNFSEIFIGHTVTQNWGTTLPIYAGSLIWNLDTGAGSDSGKLTIMDVETKEFWQSNKRSEK
jgi:serine/threonine protein phosphatase 1